MNRKHRKKGQQISVLGNKKLIGPRPLGGGALGARTLDPPVVYQIISDQSYDYYCRLYRLMEVTLSPDSAL